VRAVLDRHEAARTFDDPEYRAALDAFEARRFYRRDRERPELERMRRERSEGASRAVARTSGR
jgi:hypothetical protein